MLQIRNLTKVYKIESANVTALDRVSFTLPETGMVFLLGKSGSGKTTLLNMLGGLDAPTEGELIVDEVSSRAFKQADFDNYRNRYVGFVFQEYNLLDDLTVGANIALALNLQGKMSKADAEQKIAAALEQVGLSGYENRKSSELSGGQKQRIAIARALVKNPQMILADEPTGALDSENGQQIFDLLKAISAEKLVVVVSHDEEFARKYADRILELSDGKVICDTAPDLAGNTVRSQKESLQRHNAFPLCLALKQGLYGLRRRKLWLSVSVFLCAAAFALVGVADMITAYHWRTALVDSLYASGLQYSALEKETYLDYDFTKPNLSLPDEESIRYFNTQGNLEIKAGVPGWYGDYMFTDADLAEVTRRTGMAVKGVYRPGAANMQILNNYAMGEFTAALTSDAGRVPSELSGFMELTDADLELFGLTLLAGKLPAGDSNEIAISKYLYDAFVLAKYRAYSGPEVLFRYTNLSSGSSNTNPSADAARITMSWEEFISESGLAEVSKLWDDWAAEYGASNRTISFNAYAGKTLTIETPEDILGKPLFIAGRTYTITGIIDTGFDAAAYANITKADLDADPLTLPAQLRASVQRIKVEQASGLSCLAFVGAGSIARISAQYPQAVTMENAKILVDGCLYSSYAIKTNTLINKNTLPYTLQESYMQDESEPLFFLTYEQQKQLNNNYPSQECEIAVTWNDAHAIYNGSDWNAVGVGGGANDIVRYEWYAQVFPVTDGLILNEYAFTLLTEGRAGTYTYAISAIPRDKAAIAQYVDGCYLEQNGLRFALDNEVADQLFAADGIMEALVQMFRYISIAMLLFALTLFSVFIVLSINRQRQQIGILRALGARSKDVFLIFFTEGLLAAVASAILACACTAVACVIGNHFLYRELSLQLSLFSLDLRQIGIIFGLSLGIAFVASIIPILRIARQKPVDAIRE